jgi:hypothetical protein
MVLAYNYRLASGRCSSVAAVCAPGTAEEVWATGAWLVENAGVDCPAAANEASGHI